VPVQEHGPDDAVIKPIIRQETLKKTWTIKSFLLPHKLMDH